MIGWYVHHHGAGHLRNLQAVAPFIRVPIRVFSSLDEPPELPASQAGPVRWVLLEHDAIPDDVAESDADHTAAGHLHWAPQRSGGHTRRLATIAAHADGLAGFVVDVSAEVTMLARLLGLPTITWTLPGDRTDLPHLRAYELANAIIAPIPPPDAFSPGLFDAALPHAARFAEKLTCVGALAPHVPGRNGARPEAARAGGKPGMLAVNGAGDAGTVLVLGSRGGSELDADFVRMLAAQSSMTVVAAGIEGAPWLRDVRPAIEAADVVVTSAGLGAIADIAHTRTPAIVIPQPRPFGEQHANARLLRDLGVSVIDRAGSVTDWNSTLTRAARSGATLERWSSPRSAERVADIVHRVTGLR